MWEIFPFELGEICCQKTSLSFVDSVWEIFGPLLQGIPIVIIPDAVLKEPSQLVQALATEGVTRLVLVPSLLYVILDTNIDFKTQIPKLRYWISSGEALPIELFQRFRERVPQGVLLNLYGSSGVSADVTFYDTRKNHSLLSVPIGQPIGNTQVYCLDRALQPVPVGVLGELYIGGNGLARGYLRHPELTAEKFLPNPFSKKPGARLYKTGDLARYLPDGNLEFLGRYDSQVQLRGFRVALGEIEAVLGQHPAVGEAVVIQREDDPGDKRLVAYVVPALGQSPPVSDLRRLLKQNLPDYMVPAAFVLLEALPLTANGKVDRRALPAPKFSAKAIDAAYVPPRTPTEELLAVIWAEVLGVEQVGVHDNFFDLGGHSLKATRVISRIQATFQVDLPMHSLFEKLTVADMAEQIETICWATQNQQASHSAIVGAYEEGES